MGIPLQSVGGVAYCGRMSSAEGPARLTSRHRGRSAHLRRFHRIKKVREKARKRRALDLTWRVGVFIVGGAIVTAGVIMLITPGPGWLVIIIGLAVLSTEYGWADRMLNHVSAVARRAAGRALDTRKRRRNQIILAVTALLVAVVSGLYLMEYGFTLAPLLGNE